jgi:hypothetical protein
MDELPADTAGVALTGSLAAVQRGVDPGAGDLAVPLATYRPPARPAFDGLSNLVNR